MEGIEEFLCKRTREGLLRVLRPASCRKGGKIYIGDREYIDFSSNDYLGLSNHPKLIEAAKETLTKYGASSSASRLLSGDLDIHHELEDAVARLKNKERALIFSSGYQANIGIVSSFCGAGDAVFCDRLCHASIIDGILLSGAKLFRFRHNDAGHLEGILKKERCRFKNILIVTETIFSMDGDRPDLKALLDIKAKYGCNLMVDEAHATGIYGASGSGVVEEEGFSREVDYIMGTFGKALGSFGAYLAASKSDIDYLINKCRSFIYSTALPPAIVSANLASIKLLSEEPYRRMKLLESAKFLRDGLKVKGFDVRGCSQIIPLVTGDNERTVAFADFLKEKGYWVMPIRPPTVPEGESRLRFSVVFEHDISVLERLLDDISNAEI
ncbi:MAG: 8-amino-7-oxononanoate synthase [Candidatus Omnitrophica bacterium CG23_combo_of_CG06-09_8_20_14_all_40_11]|nr:MAG: 8-amino-7-oxononanoate synthase [Candidatus Omnitrophica bacterium CG23_combo_of_CG06-09_8_20_14_all_40_11]